MTLRTDLVLKRDRTVSAQGEGRVTGPPSSKLSAPLRPSPRPRLLLPPTRSVFVGCRSSFALRLPLWRRLKPSLAARMSLWRLARCRTLLTLLTLLASDRGLVRVFRLVELTDACAGVLPVCQAVDIGLCRLYRSDRGEGLVTHDWDRGQYEPSSELGGSQTKLTSLPPFALGCSNTDCCLI